MDADPTLCMTIRLTIRLTIRMFPASPAA